MKTVLATFAVAVLSGLASAKVAFTNSAYDVEAGVPIKLTWSGAEGAVTITLKTGPTNDLTTVSTIDSGDSSGEYTWTPSASLTSGTYALEITDGTTTNYSPEFTFSGSSASSTAASSTAASSSAASSSAAASTTSSSAPASSSAAASTTSSSSSSSSSQTSSPTTSSESSSVTSSVPNNNGAYTLAAPLVAPILLAAGIAAM